MSITSTRKINSTSSSYTKTKPKVFSSNNASQFVEDIDTNNNVLVKDDNEEPFSNSNQQKEQKNPELSSNGLTSNINSLALSEMLEEGNTPSEPEDKSQKLDVYASNQYLVKDEEIERTGRNYLKQFYEKNEPVSNVDKFI